MAKVIIVGSKTQLRQQAFKAFNIPEQNAYIANTKERAAAEFFRAYPQEDICSVDAGSLGLDNSFSANIAWTTEEVSRNYVDASQVEADNSYVKATPQDNVQAAIRQVLIMAEDRIKRTKETERVLHDGSGNYFAVGEDNFLHNASLWAVRPRTKEELVEHVRIAASYGKELHIENLRAARERDLEALCNLYNTQQRKTR
jgi:hypothetical protein